jgi:type I restriction enzyme S subunit
VNADSTPSPAGWEIKQLDAVATTQLGKTINPREKRGPLQRPYLRNANVQWDHFDLSDVATMHFSEDESNHYKLKPGDLLVCEGGMVGRGAIWEGQIAGCQFQNALHRIKPRSSEVTNSWLLENIRWLSLNGSLADRARGNTILHLSQNELRRLPVLVPSRSVQDRLISLLLEARTSQESASVHLAAAGRAIERFRQAVITAACSGRLTRTWRDTKTSRDMNRLLEERAAAGERKTRRGVDPGAPLKPLLAGLDLPGAWARITVSHALVLGALDDVKDGNHGSNHPKISEFSPQGLPFIAANLVHDGVIDYDSAPRVSGKPLERLRIGFAKANDVILTHKGSVGRVAISDRDCVLTPQTTYYRCDSSLILPEYLAIYLRSLYFYLQLAEEMSQTTRDFVPISDQYLLGLIVPSPEEQGEIVRRVKSLLAVAATIDRKINSASHRVERSSQAVLAKAFRGELTPSEIAIAASKRDNQDAAKARQ